MKNTAKNFAQAKIGNILYQDFSFSGHFNLKQNQEPIGVILNVDARKNNLLALALHNCEFPLMWSDGHADIPQTERISLITDRDFKGEENTKNILKTSLALEIVSPAASFCNSYQTPSTEKGDWFLPAIDQLIYLDSLFMLVNSALSRLPDAETIISREEYWSSSEFSYRHARYFRVKGPKGIEHLYYDLKTSVKLVRPMILVHGTL